MKPEKKYQPVIGLEIHVQLKTKTKMFCGCDAQVWAAEPNSHVCPVCLGLPGALPVINKKAVDQVIKMGLALNCEINNESFFERKNYFYPDLPKGYQISQHRRPFCVNGNLEVNGAPVGITDIHLEEDTGKSIHSPTGQYTLLDFNKSGIPLMEIVSAPDIRTAEQAVAYCKLIQQIVRYLNISDGDIEKGQMRFEVNVSIGKMGRDSNINLPDYRVEIKNLNSFRFVQKAIEYEIKRQSRLLDEGAELIQETRGFDEAKELTISQREKEQAHDYRYFPEPDLPPLKISEREIEQLADEIPELPHQARVRLAQLEGVSQEQAGILVRERSILEYFDHLCRQLAPERAANLIINQPELMGDYSPQELVNKLEKEEEEQIRNEDDLESIAGNVIEENPQPVADYCSGNENALQYLIGQMMKETKGKADPKISADILKQLLKSAPSD